MKNFKVKWLLLSIILSIASTNTVWAYNTLYLCTSDNSWSTNTENLNNATNGLGYYLRYTPENMEFIFYMSYQNKYMKRDLGDHLKPGDGGMNFDKAKSYNCNYNGKAGIVAFKSKQYDDSNADDYPWIWLERPTVQIKHKWNNSDTKWTAYDMTDNEDGTYSYTGYYSGSNATNFGVGTEGSTMKYISNATLVGSPGATNKCLFVYNSSGYQGRGSQSQYTGSATIYKIWTVTYDGNGKTSGTVPTNTDAAHGLASTLATNTGSLTKSHCIFTGWNTKADGTGIHYDAGSNEFTTTSNTTLYAEWQPVWAIKGGNSASQDGSDALGDWKVYNGLAYNSTITKYECSIELAANTTYQFKVCDRGNSDRMYGYGTAADYDLAFIGTTATGNVYYNSGTDHNVRLMTAGAGTYTFIYSWNSDHGELQVIFPTVTHPSSDYVYFKDTENWNSTKGGVVVHLTGGTTTGTNSMPSAGSCTFAGVTYYFTSLGNNTSVRFSGKDNVASYTTGNQSASSNKGKFYEYSSSSWKAFTVSVNLNNQSATTAGASSVTATYNAAMPSIASNKPAKTGYTWGGYFKEVAGGSTQYYNGSGTSAHVWDQTGASPSIYAKWTQNITLNQNGATTSGSTSLAATYNAVLDASGIANPSRTNYTFAGWTNGEGGTGTVVINTSKVVQTVASWTDGSKKWIHDDASILYAKWTENLHDVAVAAGDHGSVSVDEVTNIGVATASSTITATADDGYDFNGWTLPTGVTAAEGYTAASNPISINATADDITITANFTAHTYNIALGAGDHGAADGSATVVFNTSALATVSHVSANPGYHLDGYYDGELKVLNLDGSFAGTNVSGYITDGKWSKYDDATLTAKFSPVPLYYRANSTSWNTAANWTPNCVPTIAHDVIIEKPVSVDVATAQAKSVRILSYGDYTGKVTIAAQAGLVVAEDILAKHKSDGSYEATSKEDLQIRTGASGNGGLITGSACAHDTAEYVFYTKAYKYTYLTKSYYINQYIGIPFVDMYAYQLYGFNIFVYDGTADDWRTPGSTTLQAWDAYNLIRKYSSDDWSYFYLDGILNLPGKTGTKTFTCGWRATDRGSIDEEDGHQDYLFANSWTAPISIKDITSADCSGTGGADLVQNIYIFNAGYVGDGQKTLGDYAGTWSTFPLASSAYMDGAVIPATQAFMVTSKKGSSGATLTLDYEKHVYDPATAGSGMNTSPTRAPRREQTDDAPNVLKIVVSNDSVNADQLYLFEREDFSYGFDDGWDGHKVPGLAIAAQLYAINGSSQMAVNAVPDMNGVGIGFKAGAEASEYTFSFEYADDAEPIYLYDFDTQVYTLISNDATYTFTTSDKDEHARFAITRNNAPQIATDYEQMEAGMVQHAEKFLKNDMLFIRRGGKIYNAEGILVK